MPWRAFPWLADGSITEVDGKAKTAGKTTFAMHLVRAVLNGAPFLGQETVATPIVYLSEQAPTSLRATLARVGLLDRDDLAIMLIRDARGQPWPDLVAASVAECERIGAQMLIVDTLPQFAGLKAEAENDSGAALEAMAPLQAAAERGLAVLLTRHDRKGGGEVGESARGSTAWTGAVDTVINLTRDAGRATVRKMATISRFDAAPEELMTSSSTASTSRTAARPPMPWPCRRSPFSRCRSTSRCAARPSPKPSRSRRRRSAEPSTS